MISEVYDAFRSAGVAEEKARAAAEALSAEQLATKADIARLEQVTRGDIAKLEGVTKADIARLEGVTKADIARLEGVTKADIARLERVTMAEIAKLEKEALVVKWMLGLVIVAVVIPLIRPFFS